MKPLFLFLLLTTVTCLNLFNTGIDSSNQKLPNGAIDSHWNVAGVSLPCNDDPWNPSNPYSGGSYAVFWDGWVNPGNSSNWINFSPHFDGIVGCHYYSLRFQIPPQCSLANLNLSYIVAVDDLITISLNGIVFGTWNQYQAFSPVMNIPDYVLQPGLNEMRVMVENAGGGPAGFALSWVDTSGCDWTEPSYATSRTMYSTGPIIGGQNVTVFNTGVDDNFQKQALSQTDNHWKNIGSSIPCNNDAWNPVNPSSPAFTYVVYNSAWVDPGSNSSWINIIPSGSNPVSCHFYSFLFQIPSNCLLSSLNLNYVLAADDRALVSVNSIFVNYANSFRQFSDTLTIPSSALRLGTNEIRVMVENTGGPAGFVLNWASNQFTCAPLPPTTAPITSSFRAPTTPPTTVSPKTSVPSSSRVTQVTIQTSSTDINNQNTSSGQGGGGTNGALIAVIVILSVALAAAIGVGIFYRSKMNHFFKSTFPGAFPFQRLDPSAEMDSVDEM